MSIGDLVRRLLPERRAEYRWGTVEAVSPLRVRMQGPGGGQVLAVPPISLVSPRVGDTVRVAVDGHSYVVDGIVGGGSDTGWLPLTFAAGFTNQHAAVRVRHGVREFRGSILNTALTAGAYITAATLPAAAVAPAGTATIQTIAANARGAGVILRVLPGSAALEIYTYTAGNHWVGLSGLTAPID